MLPEKLLELLREEAAPVVGCTEPVAIALAAAHAYHVAPGDVSRLEVLVSPNVFKNAKAVGIPGTSHTGVDMAAALGVSISPPALDLNIFSSVKDADVKKALALLEKGLVHVDIDYDLTDSLYIEVRLATSSGEAEAIIQGRHTDLVYLKHNQRLLVDKRPEKRPANGPARLLRRHSIYELIDLVLALDPEALSFLKEGAEMNLRMAREGMGLKNGLGVGLNWKQLCSQGLTGKDLSNKIAYYTAAACDARMAGVQLPVLSIAGSGNHGLVATIPISLAARELGSPPRREVQALAISQLVTNYIKTYTGRLSPICGCGVAAGAGSGAGLVYLLQGSKEEMGGAIKNIISSLAGMICDGGKVGCALKLCTSAATAWQGALLARAGVTVPPGNGFIADSVEESLHNLGRICREGMAGVDRTIISILEQHRRLDLLPREKEGEEQRQNERGWVQG
ncbi:MAG: serine dehydratase subunit alpha family protein [Firmicutes bacterium]|mgnify:CR=1 FL=1|jgi:L-cysteine desulfidase|nr:serine dehydratase subunit alpha family protein [Bacillota bacterium]HPU01846.1 L-serine ammonia-lyase, iron-sulfur-dependent, subunit alpha [Bacillota bacterium]